MILTSTLCGKHLAEINNIRKHLKSNYQEKYNHKKAKLLSVCLVEFARHFGSGPEPQISPPWKSHHFTGTSHIEVLSFHERFSHWSPIIIFKLFTLKLISWDNLTKELFDFK